MTAASTPHAPHRKYEVTPLELFFDLVFVFAVSQPQVSPRLRLTGNAAPVVVGGAALMAPPYVALILVGASLTTLVIIDAGHS